jgi:hypothetical protein
MKTLSGLEIENFKKIENPIKNGILETHIYEGTIKNVPSKYAKENPPRDYYCTWDKLGKCSNYQREDCFIDPEKAKETIYN